MYLSIALQNFSKKPLTYLYSGESNCVGHRVLVPFGKKQKLGVVIEVLETSDIPSEKLKPIIKILDETSLLTELQIQFFKRIALYYHHSLNELILSAIPNGLLDQDTNIDPIYYQANGHGTTKSQQNILNQCHKPISNFELYKRYTKPILETLIRHKLLVAVKPTCPKDSPNLATLSDFQQKAYQELKSDQSLVKVLWGATGCGKTEIYAHLIADRLTQSQQVLLLVPEIALTPQTVNKIAKRVGSKPVILHSQLSKKQRAYAWLQVRHGQAGVIIGTRSALLCPIPRLGLIIIDEEHSDAYRQEGELFYSARDTAVLLSHKLNTPLVLGSATPSLESLYNAKQKKYALCQLTEKFHGNSPKVEVVTLQKDAIIDPIIIDKIKDSLNQNQHVMLYIGKRGYSRVLSCHQCGYKARCSGCDKLYTSHNDQKLHCHQCNLSVPMIIDCPSCQQSELSHYGFGSQQIEELINKLFPQTPCIRIDTDNMNSLECGKTLSQLQDAPATIVVGTQMITKGHDIERLNLVVVLNSDHHLYSPDFRSEEKLYAELTQVAGRSGRRGDQAYVYIQTQHPNHHIFKHLHNPNSWFEYLLTQRKDFGLPPYQHLACIFIRGRESALNKLLTINLPYIDGVDIQGPIAFPSGNWRGQNCHKVLVMSTCRVKRQHALQKLWALFTKYCPNGVSIRAQVDSHLSI